MEYLILLISVFLVCLAVKVYCKLQLFDTSKAYFLVFGSLFAIGSALDSFALLRGYWSYQQRFLVGMTIGVMPLEEYVFMIVIPFLTIVVYRLVDEKAGRKRAKAGWSTAY